MAINTLPMIRFTLNMLVLNLGYILVVTVGSEVKALWFQGILITLLVTSFYFAQTNSLVLGHVILPSALDRKLFYPLLIFVEMLLIGVPALSLPKTMIMAHNGIWSNNNLTKDEIIKRAKEQGWLQGDLSAGSTLNREIRFKVLIRMLRLEYVARLRGDSLAGFQC